MARKTVENAGQENVVLTKFQPSVQIKRNAKGSFEFEVKTYADTIEDAMKQAIFAVTNLDQQFGEHDG